MAFIRTPITYFCFGHESIETFCTFLLRRQSGKNTPDIRIEKNSRTIAIIEVKAKGGWIQSFLSKDRYDRDSAQGKNPQATVDRVKGQLDKYRIHFSVPAERVFFLLPTLKLVDRKKYERNIEDYFIVILKWYRGFLKTISYCCP